MSNDLVDYSCYKNAIISWNTAWPLASRSSIWYNFNPYHTIKRTWNWFIYSVYLRGSITIRANSHVNISSHISILGILKSLDGIWIDRSTIVQWIGPNNGIWLYKHPKAVVVRGPTISKAGAVRGAIIWITRSAANSIKERVFIAVIENIIETRWFDKNIYSVIQNIIFYLLSLRFIFTIYGLYFQASSLL